MYFNLKRNTFCTLALLFLMPQFAQSQTFEAVDYIDLKPLLLGNVDFEELDAPHLPGLPIDYVRRYPGLAIGTMFEGQVNYRAGVGAMASNHLSGHPATPLRAVKRHGHRTVIFAEMDTEISGTSNVVIGVARTPTDTRFVDNVGFGSLTLGFSDRQYAIGLRIQFLPSESSKKQAAQLRFYDDLGGWMNQTPITIHQSGYYGLKLQTEERLIQGISLTNGGTVGFAIDDIIYEIPPLIGLLPGTAKPG